MSNVAGVYAQALYSLAKEDGKEKVILDQMDALCQSFAEEPAFLQLLSAPNLSKTERCDILDDSFRGRIEQYLLNFMKLLTEKGYARHFPDCCKVYRDAYNTDHGILPVKAVTAVPLTESQLQKLTDKLKQVTGKSVQIINRIDPAVLGGIRLDYDGKRVDGTVQNRLDTIGSLLKNTVL